MAVFEESLLQVLIFFAISYLINSYIFKYFIINPFFVMGGPGGGVTTETDDSSETITITRLELKKLIEDQVQKALVNTPSTSSGSSNVITTAPLASSDGTGNMSNIASSVPPANVSGGFLSHVSFKAPQPLYSQNPSVWFAILEHQFTIANITQEPTKFSHAVSNLDARLHNTFANLIIRDKGATPYSTFKEEVIKNLGESEKTKLHNLLHGLSLGDQKPSQLLLKFKTDAGDNFSAESLRQLWMSRLPPQVQIVLTPFENDVPISVLAQRADDVMETMSQVNANYSNQVIASNSSKTLFQLEKDTPSIDTKLTTMKSEILAEISSLMGGNKHSRGRPNHKRESSRDRSPSKSRNSSGSTNSKSEVCYYHKRFNNKAQKCVSSCKYHQEFLNTSKND